MEKRKIYKISCSILVCASMLFSIPNITVKAASSHGLSVKIYDEDADYNGSGDEIQSGSSLEKNKEFKVEAYFDYVGTEDDVNGFTVNLLYDTDVFEMTYYEGEANVYQGENALKGGVFPATERRGVVTELWPDRAPKFNPSDPGIIKLLTQPADSRVAGPTNSGALFTVYLKVKEDASPGAQGKIYISSNSFMSDRQANKIVPVISSPTILTVAGATPTIDTSLSNVSLTATSNNHDYMSGLFNKDTKSYDVVVPGSVSEVEMDATATDPSSGLELSYGREGNKNKKQQLNYGNNELKIIPSHNGQTLNDGIVTMNVYRLDNRNSLQSITLTESDGVTLLQEDKDNKTIFYARQTTTSAMLNYVAPNNAVVTLDSKINVAGSIKTLNIDASPLEFTIGIRAEEGDDKYSSVYGVDTTLQTPAEHTYTIIKKSNDVSLESLKVLINGAEKQAFDVSGTTKKFNLDVDNDTTTVTIAGIMNDTAARFRKIKDIAVDTAEVNQDIVLNTTSAETVIPIEVVAADGTKETYEIKVTRKLKSNADLANYVAKIDGQTVYEYDGNSFDPSDISIDYKKDAQLVITATAADNDATIVSGVDSFNLSVGTNTYTVKVRAQDGTTKDYTLKVTMNPNTENQVDVDETKYTPVAEADRDSDLSGTDKQYVIRVPYETKTYSWSNLGLTLPDNATYQLGHGSDPLNLNFDESGNNYDVTVKAQSGAEQKYRFKIIRTKSAVAGLSLLEVVSNPQGTLSPAFNSDQKTYDFNVRSNVLRYEIRANALQDGQIVIDGVQQPTGVGSFDITASQTSHTVKVQSQDGSKTETYTISIIREKSNDSTLAELKANGKVVTFDADRKAMIEVASDVETVNFEYRPTNPNATIKLNDRSYPDNTHEVSVEYGSGINNQFTFVVTAEDGSVRSYTATINRKMKENTLLNSITTEYGTTTPKLIAGFASDKRDYGVVDTVPFDTKMIRVKATLNDSDAICDACSLSGKEYPLVVGENNISIEVKAHERSVTGTYTFKVTRLPNSSTEIGADNLELNIENNGGIQPKSDEEHAFVIFVPYNKKTFGKADVSGNFTGDLTGTTVEYGPDISLNNKNKNNANGENVYTLTVVSADKNNRQDYKLYIQFLQSENPLLEAIQINGQTVTEFDPDASDVQTIAVDSYLAGKVTLNLTATPADGAKFKSNLTPFPWKIDLKGKATTDVNKPILIEVWNTVESQKNTYKFVFTRTLSNNTDIGDITINDELAIRDFQGDYSIEVNDDVATATILVPANHEGASVLINGSDNNTITLDYGENTLEVKVVAEDGTEGTPFNVTIVREKKADNKITNITASLDGQNIPLSFVETTSEYNLGEFEFKNNAKLLLSVTTSDSDATVTGDGEQAVVVGENTYIVYATAQNGDKGEEYTVKLTMKPNSDAVIPPTNLSPTNPDHSISEETVSADGTRQYTVTVSNEVETFGYDNLSLTLPAGATRSDAAPINLSTTEKNEFKFSVTAQDTTTVVNYVINVIREKSAVARLTKLEIESNSASAKLSPDFDPTKLSYVYTVEGDINQFSVIAEAYCETYEVVADADCKYNKVISGGNAAYTINSAEQHHSIVVRAENGDEETYTVTVMKATDTDASLTELKINGNNIPGFESRKYEYDFGTVVADSGQVTVEAMTNNEAATATVQYQDEAGNVQESLKAGYNDIVITVTAPDNKTTKTYTVTVFVEGVSGADDSSNIVENPNAGSNPETQIQYIAYVPYGTTSFGKDSIKIAVKKDSQGNESVINYPLGESIPVSIFDNEKDDKNIFVYEITHPGSAKETVRIKVIVENSEYPKIDHVTINDIVVTPFDKNNPTPTIALSDYLDDATNNPQFTFEIFADPDVTITGSSVRTIDALGYDVYSEDVALTNTAGETSTYNFKFTRNKSKNNNLVSVDVSYSGNTETISEFPEGIAEITLPADVNSFTLANAVMEHSGASISSGLGTFNNVNPGKNIYIVKVRAEAYPEPLDKEYTIIVTRSLALETLTIGSKTVDVTSYTDDNGVHVYTINESFGVDESVVTVSATANGSVDFTGLGPVELNPNANELNILMVAKDGVTSQQIKVLVNRTPSSDATLKTFALTNAVKDLEGKQIQIENFDPSTKEYSITVPYTFDILDWKTHLVVEANHSKTTVTGDDPFNVALGDSTLTIHTLAEDGVTTDEYRLNIHKEGYNLLESLSLGDAGSLNETFSPLRTNYTATMFPGVTSFRFYYATNASKYPGTRITNADELENLSVYDLPKTFEIKVASANNDIRTYTVEIDTGLSARLSNLTTNQGEFDPSFDPNVVNYIIDVEKDVDTISLTPTVEDDDARIITAADQYQNVRLIEKETVIAINVENGNYKRTYTVTVFKGRDKFGIDEIIVKDGEKEIPITFDENNGDNGSYEVIIDKNSDPNNLDIEVDQTDKSKTVEIRGPEDKGTHIEYQVVIKDGEGNEKSYPIVVKKKVSDNNYLQSLSINEISIPGFDKTKTNYEYVMTKAGNLVAVGIPEDEDATVTYQYPTTFEDGSKIVISVMSESGNIRNYEVTIQKELDNTAFLESLSVEGYQVSPTFNKLTRDYNVNIPYENDKITIVAVAENNGEVTIIDEPTTYPVGTTTVVIQVKAENGDINTYSLHVTRNPEADNKLDSLVVKDKEDTVYNLVPAFDPSQLHFVVTVPEGITDFVIEATSKAGNTVSGTGDIVVTDLPVTHNIVVSDQDGNVRTYSVEFVKAKSSNSKLNDIILSAGQLKPIFNPETLVYDVEVDYDTKNIELNPVKGHEGQTVNIRGNTLLRPGKNTFLIDIVAEDGVTTTTYSVVVNRDSQDFIGLNNLVVTPGELSPIFDPEKKVYYVSLPEIDDIIDIETEADDKFTVEGQGPKELNMGTNTFPIKVSDETRETTYYVIVNRGPVDSVYLAHLGIDKYPLKETFDKLSFDYSSEMIVADTITPKIEAIAEDPNATVTISPHDDLSEGNHPITITVSLPDGRSQVYNLNIQVMNLKLKSTVHNLENDFVKTIKPNKTVLDIKNEFTNDNSMLVIYRDGQALTDADTVGTGDVIKLVYQDVSYDQRTLIILGDINGDGKVSVPDVLLIRSAILGVTITDVQKAAADINNDGNIRVNDLLAIRGHILKSNNIHNW